MGKKVDVIKEDTRKRYNREEKKSGYKEKI